MGEVYRAHDSRLGRDVALKILHSDVALNADRRTRFEREARAVAALNHPNIVALYDIGEENGIVYFVSELVEGEPLRSRIARGPMPVRELLDIAVQMADGIAAAHAAGITHRDLKPENVMITREVRVKILDFGLARQNQAAAPAPERTVTMHETQPGTVMGTANYMSPEQVRGGAVDFRSDQFSFGIMLYEMATGKQAFQRETAIQTMSAVIADDPPVMEPGVQSKLPPPLRWVIERCLAKEPSRRYESTRDLYEDLRSQRDHLSEAFSTAGLPEVRGSKAPASRNLWKLASGLLLLIALGLAVLLVMSRNSGNNIGNYRFTPFAVSSEGQGNPIWSPDGKAAAYLGEVNGTYRLFVRYLNAEAANQLTAAGISGLYGWSADSRRIFFRGNNPDRSVPKNAVFSIAAIGGDPELLMAIDAVTATISPDAKTLAIYKQDADGFRRIYISSPIGSPLQPYPSARFATKAQINTPRLFFSPDGKKLLFLVNDGIEKRWLLPYPAAPNATGTAGPHEVLSSLPQSGFTPAFAWFPDSRHIVLASPAYLNGPLNLWSADTAGPNLRRLTSTPSSQHLPSVSPDGKRILYQEIGSDLDIAKVSLTDGKMIRLISTDRDEYMPAWAASAPKFAYVTTRNGPPEIWVRNEDGSDRPLVTSADFAPAAVSQFMNPLLTPEADRVVYTMREIGGKTVLYISSVSGGDPARVTNSGNSVEVTGSLSPDGKQLVYLELSGDRAHLMLVKTSGQATATQLRDNVNNALPQWSPAGEWITFNDNDGWNLLSPDGKTVKRLGQISAHHLAFSTDGKKLYGIRDEKEHEYLFSMDVSGSSRDMKTISEIGRDYAPASYVNPGYRLSVAPDGTCAIYSIARYKSSIWLFEGFQQ